MKGMVRRTLPGYWTWHAALGEGWDSVHGHSPICASHVPAGPCSPETCMARGAVGQGLPALQDVIPKIWTVLMCSVSPLRDTLEFDRGYERAESILWSSRIAAHTEIFWMGAVPWGCTFKVCDGPWMSKSWGKLPLPPLQRLPTHPTSKVMNNLHTGTWGFVSDSFFSHPRRNHQDKILTMQPL